MLLFWSLQKAWFWLQEASCSKYLPLIFYRFMSLNVSVTLQTFFLQALPLLSNIVLILLLCFSHTLLRLPSGITFHKTALIKNVLVILLCFFPQFPLLRRILTCGKAALQKEGSFLGSCQVVSVLDAMRSPVHPRPDTKKGSLYVWCFR